MKNLIGLIVVILLCTTSVFGQNLNSESHIKKDMHWSSLTNIAHFYTDYTYEGEILRQFMYVLAYEPNFPNCNIDGTKRNVYLYAVQTIGNFEGAKFRIHYDWIRVSDVVLVGYRNNTNDLKEHDFHLYDERTRNTSHSHVEVNEDNNEVTFTIDVYKREPKNDSYVYSSYQETVTLELVMETLRVGNYYKVKK